MDVKSYCDTVGIELIGWKAKLYDVLRRSERMTSDDQEKVEPLIAELKDIMEDLDEHIALLARECPAEWSGRKSDIDAKISSMNDKWKAVWGVMGEPEYGIGGA